MSNWPRADSAPRIKKRWTSWLKSTHILFSKLSEIDTINHHYMVGTLCCLGGQAWSHSHTDICRPNPKQNCTIQEVCFYVRESSLILFYLHPFISSLHQSLLFCNMENIIKIVNVYYTQGICRAFCWALHINWILSNKYLYRTYIYIELNTY